MRTFYAYPAVFEPGDIAGNIVVTFPDVPEAISQGDDEVDGQRRAGCGAARHSRRQTAAAEAVEAGERAIVLSVGADLATKIAV